MFAAQREATANSTATACRAGMAAAVATAYRSDGLPRWSLTALATAGQSAVGGQWRRCDKRLMALQRHGVSAPARADPGQGIATAATAQRQLPSLQLVPAVAVSEAKLRDKLSLTESGVTYI